MGPKIFQNFRSGRFVVYDSLHRHHRFTLASLQWRWGEMCSVWLNGVTWEVMNMIIQQKDGVQRLQPACSLLSLSVGAQPDCHLLSFDRVTLDTPMNRKFMPDADFGSWTPLEYVAEWVLRLIMHLWSVWFTGCWLGTKLAVSPALVCFHQYKSPYSICSPHAAIFLLISLHTLSDLIHESMKMFSVWVKRQQIACVSHVLVLSLTWLQR